MKLKEIYKSDLMLDSFKMTWDTLVKQAKENYTTPCEEQYDLFQKVCANFQQTIFINHFS